LKADYGIEPSKTASVDKSNAKKQVEAEQSGKALLAVSDREAKSKKASQPSVNGIACEVKSIEDQVSAARKLIEAAGGLDQANDVLAFVSKHMPAKPAEAAP
jgi:hypothetical protein